MAAASSAAAAPAAVGAGGAGRLMDQELTCEACQKPFIYSAAEHARDERSAYPPPRLCPDCLRQRRGAKAAERAARRPRRKYFRR